MSLTEENKEVMIECFKLSKTFKVHKKEAGLKGSLKSLFNRQWIKKMAVDEVSLQVRAGEIVGLVGANGAGKTTLVKMLSGVVFPTSGDAKVLGYTPWERNNQLRKNISLIMGQKASLWWDLPAGDCFLLLKEIYQIPDDLYYERLFELTESLDVKDQIKIQVRKLSLGERMKMELIAALLHRPKVIYLDEPTIGLDLTSQKTIRRFLLDYQKKYQPAIILTSHYMEDIAQLCNRLIIIRKGQFVYDGPIEKVLNKYGSLKIISAKLDPENAPKSLCDFPSNFGETITKTPTELKVKVTEENLPKAASFLLENYPVKDLGIEETDISEIIEDLMTGEKSS